MNNLYSTSNITYGLSTTIASYYLEFWFMIDNINTPNSISSLAYFYAPPHRITQELDGKFKYSYAISSTTWSNFYILNSINKFEWNRIIIKNYNNPLTSNWEISVYINYVYSSPELSLIISNSSINMNLLGILFCSNALVNCIIGGVTYNSIQWGNAWYKNVRIWDYTTSSLPMIQNFERVYNYFYLVTLITRQHYLIIGSCHLTHLFMIQLYPRMF